MSYQLHNNDCLSGDGDFSPFGFDLFGEPITPKPQGPLHESFLIPPFSVLDARQGVWAQRKKAWLGIGINSELGRKKDLILNPSIEKFKKNPIGNGTSVFDPVLTELAYRWFCPDGGQIVDPFAGGSVRGIVACCLGRKYWGCDLRPEQIAANVAQAERITPNHKPTWVCGDSKDELLNAPKADFVLSCPPYGDLEKYCDDARDLSNMGWGEFMAAYQVIINKSMQILKNDAFACFVVSDFRDKRGFYRNFVSKTIEAFEVAGARLYNDIVLITPVGSAAYRASRQFNGGRKVIKTHQNVLIFCKGSWRKAAAKCQMRLAV